ncbi:MAG TPA: carboxypeptidase regulatory-like domain-containing protein [Candidatus Eisenbacteria bacterium]|jgi:hypothetical protein
MLERPALVLLLLSAPAAVGASARAGVIRGSVQLPAVPPAPKRALQAYAGTAAALPQPRVPVRGAPEDAVIYIEVLPASVDSTLPASLTPPRLAQQEQSFVPRVVVVPAGGAVDFPNLDGIYHNVFSVSPIKRFDLGRYGRGKSKSVTFQKTGLVNVYCDIHANMEGFILVVPNRAFAQPDAAGRYALPELPPGRYTVLAWHPDLASIRREVTVPPDGDAVLDLSFER